MTRNRCLLAIVALASFAHGAVAMDRAECERNHAARSGQAGKDVIWLPSMDVVVTAMLEAANTTADDYVIDLGAGDGKIPIAAAKQFGARALGIEYDHGLVQLARCYVEAESLTERVRIEQGDIFATDFSEATVLTMYLLPSLNLRLRPTILQLRPGTRVVSNSFQMGDWRPDRFIEPKMGNTHAYLWIVPARIEGTWRFEQVDGSDAFELSIQQRYQDFSATLPSGVRGAVRNGQLDGANIKFTLVRPGRPPLELRGTVTNDRMELAGYNGRRTAPGG